MKPEYREKLEELKGSIARLYADEQDEKYLTQDEMIRQNHYYSGIMDDLVRTQDKEVLHELVGLFNKTGEGRGMLDESLYGQIIDYYPPGQIMEAFFERFDSIYDEGEEGMAYVLELMFKTLWDGVVRYPVGAEVTEEKGCFPEFREMFNRVRPSHAEDFLEGMMRWLCKTPEDKVILETLRSDMKKWGRNEDSEKKEKAEEMAKAGR
jgi:hypothetical protein